ncbi:hypothetical protein ACU8V3_11230 [Cobetia marina]
MRMVEVQPHASGFCRHIVGRLALGVTLDPVQQMQALLALLAFDSVKSAFLPSRPELLHVVGAHELEVQVRVELGQ